MTDHFLPSGDAAPIPAIPNPNSLKTVAARLSGYADLAEMTYTSRFEATAERFYAATGLLAPGKSVPLGMPMDEGERSRAWAKFQAEEGEQYRSDLRAAAAALVPSSQPETPTEPKES